MACEEIQAEIDRLTAILDNLDEAGGTREKLLRIALERAKLRLRACQGGGYSTSITLIDLTGSITLTSVSGRIVVVLPGGSDNVVERVSLNGGMLTFGTTPDARH